MTVDRQKVLDAFAAYIRPYDAQDPKVSLKIHHTYRVAALCEQIGRSIALEGRCAGSGLAMRHAARCRPL